MDQGANRKEANQLIQQNLGTGNGKWTALQRGTRYFGIHHNGPSNHQLTVIQPSHRPIPCASVQVHTTRWA